MKRSAGIFKRPGTRSRRRLAQCAEGITTLEFAFLVPVFLLIMMGIVEFSLVMFTLAVMDSATNNTSRLGKTGFVAEGSSREEQIIANIQNRTAGLLNPELIAISTQVYANFDVVGEPEPYTDANGNNVYNPGEPFTDINGNGQWDPDMAEAGLGEAGDIVIYTVNYPWNITTPIVSAIIGNPVNLTVRSVIKNEPF